MEEKSFEETTTLKNTCQFDPKFVDLGHSGTFSVQEPKEEENLIFRLTCLLFYGTCLRFSFQDINHTHFLVYSPEKKANCYFLD